MGKFYKIREGFSVALTPQLAISGGVIELDDDQAEVHKHKIELLSDDEQAKFLAERETAADALAVLDAEADAKRKAALDADAKAAVDAAKQAKDAAKNA